MFTGIIQSLGTIRSCERRDGDVRLGIATGSLDLSNVRTGDSIAISGVCLTVVECSVSEFSADISSETLSRTTLGSLRPGDAVNLEKALTLGSPLGGHLVSGHVDGVGSVLHREPEGRSVRYRLGAPAGLARYIAEKGSIGIDGVSLTINLVHGAEFEVNLVPHTLAVTTLGSLAVGSPVNLEVDLLARYVERLIHGGSPARSGATITREFLTHHGFIPSSD